MAATTSGTVAQTTVLTSTVMDHAVRRCGKLPSTLSGEQIQTVLELLYFQLSDLANRGLSLWCQQKYVYGVVPSSSYYTLDPGITDLLNALYRTSTQLTGAALSGPNYSGIDLGESSPAAVTNVGVQFAAAQSALNLVVEGSSDGTNWVQYAAFPANLALAGGAWATLDVDNSATVEFWRIRETVLPTLPSTAALNFNTAPYEVQISIQSRDEYTNLPNKSFSVQGPNKAVQGWFDKQRTPRLWLWPQPTQANDQIVVWCQRQIQDVGALTNVLDIPQRWYESIIASLAHAVALELPAQELPPGRLEYLKALKDEQLLQAEDGENDGSPVKLQPNMRGYTQ